MPIDENAEGGREAPAPSLDRNALEQARGKLAKARARLKRNTLFFGVFYLLLLGTNVLFAVSFGSPQGSVLEALIAILTVLWFYLGLTLIFRMRFVSSAMKKGSGGITARQLGALVLFGLGGPLWFSLPLLAESKKILNTPGADRVLVEQRAQSLTSKIAGCLFPLLFVGAFVGLLAAIAVPGLMSARGRARFEEGRALMDQGRFDDAVIKFRQSLESKPFRHVYFELGVSLYRLERFEESREALEEYQRMVAKDKAFYEGSNQKNLFNEEHIATARQLLSEIVNREE